MFGSAPMFPASSFGRPAETLKARTAVAGVAAELLPRAARTAARMGRTRAEGREAMVARVGESRCEGGEVVVDVAVANGERRR